MRRLCVRVSLVRAAGCWETGRSATFAFQKVGEDQRELEKLVYKIMLIEGC